MEQNEKAKSKTRLKYIIIGLIAVVAIGGGAAYFLSGASYESTDNAQLDGNIEPVRASITAYLDTIYFEDNQQVKQGDTLMCFNTETLLAKVNQAEAALENATAALAASGNKVVASNENANASLLTSQSYQQSIIAAKANLDKAQSDLNRANDLIKVKAVTQEQLETLQTKLLLAKVDYDKAISLQKSSASTSLGLKENVKVEQSQASTAKALVKQRQAELQLAQLDLKHAYILAPFDGLITKRSVQAGQYVSTGQTLCAAIDTKHIWVSANFKETQLKKIKAGQEVEIDVDAYPNLKLKGKVESFSGATGAKFSLLPPDNSTGNFIKITQRFPLRISIDSSSLPDNKSAMLFAGLSAFVKVYTK